MTEMSGIAAAVVARGGGKDVFEQRFENEKTHWFAGTPFLWMRELPRLTHHVKIVGLWRGRSQCRTRHARPTWSQHLRRKRGGTLSDTRCVLPCQHSHGRR